MIAIGATLPVWANLDTRQAMAELMERTKREYSELRARAGAPRVPGCGRRPDRPRQSR